MSDQEFIIAPAAIKVNFEIRAVDTLFNSIMILNQAEELSGLGEWVERTRQTLPPERRRFNQIMGSALLSGFEYDEEQLEDFPAYLERVNAQDAVEARDKNLAMVLDKCGHISGETIEIPLETLLHDKATYVGLVEEHMLPAWESKGHGLDVSLFADTHDLMQDAQVMKTAVVDHLNYLWETHLRDDWNRNLPMLEACVSAFRQLSFVGQSTLEVIRQVTGRDMSEYWPKMEQMSNVTFVPSAHIGPYIAHYHHEDTTYIFFGARMPQGMEAQSPALGRSELLVRLTALADDTRLTILELLTRHEELCAQDIINQLNLSQSSASRHLRQLTATGYLVERRRDVAKCYSLSQERIDDTLDAIRHFLGS